MVHTVQILSTEPVTHNVRQFTVEKPAGYAFEPGQATEVSLMQEGWRDEKRPFTFTALPSDAHLQFTIKIYPGHDGVTEQLGQVEPGERLQIGDPWGAITDKGPGYFIAGGAGLTPFLAILRKRHADDELNNSVLIFSNKTERDIICRRELEGMDGLDCRFIVTDDPDSDLRQARIDKSFLQHEIDDFGAQFYVCGPPEMVEDVTDALKNLGASPDGITLEE